MRVALPLLALLTATAATAADAPVHLGAPAFENVPVAINLRAPQTCRDTVHAVRDERGLPELRRENAAPQEELTIKAVDHRIDGCAVMVMHHDTRDIRPLQTAPGTGQLRKIQ